MTPQELLERLEGLGLVEQKIIDKMRRQIQAPGHKIRPKAIVAYLVKKDHITKAQAAKLLTIIDTPKQIKHEELEVKVPQENTYDTDDLTTTAKEVVQEVDPQMTMDAVEADDDDEGDVVEVVDVARPAEPIVDMVQQPAPLDAPFDDPLGGHFGADYEGGYGDEGSGEHQKPVLGFRGKRLKRDQWATKWLYIGFGILGSLLIFGAVLYYAVNRVSAEDQFKAAVTSFENGSYSDSIEKFDEFIEDNPKHEKVGTAKLRRVQALIAQTYESKNWDETISRAKTQLPILLDDPDVKMDVIRDDLGVMLPNAAMQISERATKQTEIRAMEEHLEKANAAKAVVDNPNYIPTSIRKRPSVANVLDKLNNNILSVEGLIQKEHDYSSTLSDISVLAAAGETDEAFELYHSLTRKHADLATRVDLQTAMKRVSKKERELVKPVQVNISASSNPRSSDLQDSIVLASKNGTKLEANRDLITPVLAEGALYGIDSSDGSVVWRKWVGFETNIQPQLYNADLVLASDQKHHDLLMIKRLDGSVVWRAEIGEPFLAPAFNESMIVLTANSGKIMKMDPLSGQVVAAVQLPQTANVSALIAERDPYIYQPGYYSNLYVLSNDDLSCRDVYYVGHYKGSIEIPPQNWVGHVLVAVNGGNRCDLIILKPEKEDQGLDLQLVQLLNRVTTGPVKTPMLRFGRWMLVASDNGDLRILQLNPAEDETAPISKFAEEKFEKESGQPAFLLTQGSQLWIAGNGIMKYRIQGSLGKFNRQLILNHGDSFIAPLTKLEDAVLHVRRREGSGMVSVSAVDPNTLKQIWRTDLGGALAGPPFMVDGQLQAVSNQGDLFLIDSDAQSKGYAENAFKSSEIIESLMFGQAIDLGDNKFAVIGLEGRDDLLYIENGKSRLLKLQDPANAIAAPPIGLAGSLIVPSKKGQVVRIEPRTGLMIGAPFQPPIRPGVNVDWKTPVVVQNQIFAIAKGAADGSPSAVYLLDGGDGRSLKQLAGIESDSKIKSGLAVIGNTVFVVISSDQGDQLIGLDTQNGLESTGVANLPDNYVDGPWSVGDKILVRLDSDEMVCFDSKLKSKWRIGIPHERFAGSPLFANGKIAIVIQSGKLVWLESETGKTVSASELGQPVVSVRQEGNRLLFGGMDGTVHIGPTVQ